MSLPSSWRAAYAAAPTSCVASSAVANAASGVLDLGSPDGREAARLIAGQFLTGVSMDLDSATNFTPGSLTITSEGRVRAATLVAIPAFDVARLWLVDADDCGCDDTTPGVRTLTATTNTTTPTLERTAS
ncbi:MAG TPA: hypothetical protein VL043_06210 [Protaetiibacter sp.]|nr:hypothetical protein [Protaetiibacter sp.]